MSIGTAAIHVRFFGGHGGSVKYHRDSITSIASILTRETSIDGQRVRGGGADGGDRARRLALQVRVFEGPSAKGASGGTRGRQRSQGDLVCRGAQKLNAEHAPALTTRNEDHALESYEGLLAKLKEEWRVETERLNNALVTQKEESGIGAAKARTEVDKVMQNQQEAQAVLLRDIEQGHNAELAKLKTEHKAALQAVNTELEKEKAVISAEPKSRAALDEERGDQASSCSFQCWHGFAAPPLRWL
ncbi:hypothetical protein GGX14DRAFT_678247, partial [Mycena pura]